MAFDPGTAGDDVLVFEDTGVFAPRAAAHHFEENLLAWACDKKHAALG